MIKTIILLVIPVVEDFSNIGLFTAFTSVFSILIYPSFILILLSFAFLLKGRPHNTYLLLLNLLISVLYIIDLWNFRAFGDFSSLHMLGQTTNLDNLSDSVLSMVRIIDIVFLADFVLLVTWYVKKKFTLGTSRRSITCFALTLIMPICYIGLVHYKFDIVENGKNHVLFRICWSPSQTISNLSPIGYHVYDSYVYWKESVPYAISADEEKEIVKWFKDKKEDIPDNKFKGMFKGKNLIILQVESLENFVLNKKVDNQEITPNINRLLINSIYFSDVYEQVHNGTSSDAEFMVNTSVYPVRRGSTFFRFPKNTYNSLPNILEAEGYSTLAIHPDKGAYWNWMEALKGIGFERCIDSSAFEVDELIGLGLSDKSFLEQVIPIIRESGQPFYTFMITLTSHGPFNLPEEYRELKLEETLDKSKLGGYFQSINYTDKQIGKFISTLEKIGLLEDTVIVLYGDHEGIHKFYSKEVSELGFGSEVWTENNKRVPLIVYHSSINGEEIKTTGGQIDILPTVSYLMGINEEKYMDTAFGRNLLKTGKSFAVLNDRTFIGKDDAEKDHAVNGIDIADKVISGDYFNKIMNSK